MKLSKQVITLTTFSLLSLSTIAESQPSTWIEGNTIYYVGHLSDELNSNLFRLYHDNKETVNLISIESKGGEINTGLELGNFIFDHKLNVQVASYCLSSCANYVFTAGQTKYLESGAMIGFHGGASSTYFDKSQLDALSESEKAKVKKLFENYIAKAVSKETEFFNKTGVQQKITTYGQDEKYALLAQQGYAGWYYSKEALEKLGVHNIVVNAPEWQPKQPSDKIKFFKIDEIEI